LGLLDLSFRALEVSGVELFLPPVVGASGYAYLSQVTATGWGLSKVEDFKANSSFFGESIDLSELGNGIPRGEAQKVEDFQNMPGASLFPLCSSYTVQGLPSLRFSTPS
jgi:hypothetical protein